MGRLKQIHDNSTVRFPANTFARIEAILIGREGKSDFIRLAVSELLAKREAMRSPPLSAGGGGRRSQPPA